MSPFACKTDQVVAGYALGERLGAGGYGEVWKAEAPGGLTKAIKFVYGHLDDQRAACELKALSRIKEVRHPFLLSLERIEVVDGQLVIITELADGSLKDRFQELTDSGQTGIARDELLVYLRDAADALDYMSENYSLQHLDVKPENLLIVGGRVKVADFGLVKDIHDQNVSLMGGLTPVYAAPEVFDGRPSLHSDQYSLAIVYQEMLTGSLPFPGRTAAQLATQHLNSQPRLTPLTPADQETIGRALSKDPEERFATCRSMVESLLGRPPASNVTSARQGAAQAETASVKALGTDTATQPGQAEPGSDPSKSGPRPAVATIALTQQLDDEPSASAGPAAEVPPQAARPRRESAKAAPVRPERPPPLPAATPEIRELPPIAVDASQTKLRPTLVLGIGGTAANTLRKLNSRWRDRFGDLEIVPALQMLLVDTDPRTLTSATRGGKAEGLNLHQTLAMPLRQRQDYREDSDRFLQWLSRRWLFNIPRSLQTEGLRPLGRLAFVDHAEQLNVRLREAIEAMTSPHGKEASARRTGMTVSDDPPRVVVVASISGGTGSGMVVDVAYTVRKVMADLGHDAAQLTGMLAHGTARGNGNKELALANTYACLSELNHYGAVDRFPGDPACGLPAFGRGTAAFDVTYLVHLGNELDDEDFGAAVDRLAEYLYLDTVTPAGDFFAKCRETAAVEESQVPEMSLRTLGLRQIGCSQTGLPDRAAERLCRSVVERWRGQPAEGRQSSDVQAAAGAELADDAQLNLEELITRSHWALEKELKTGVKAFLQETLQPCFAEGSSEQVDPADIFARLDAALGSRAPEEDGHERPENKIHGILRRELRVASEHLGGLLCNGILELIDHADVRLHGAQQAQQLIAERLRSLDAEAEDMRKNLDSALEQTEEILRNPSLSARRRSRRWLRLARSRNDGPGLEEQWLQYAHSRLDRIVLVEIRRLCRSLLAKVAAVNERLNNLSRDLYALVDAFDANVQLVDAPHDEDGPLSTDKELETSIAVALGAHLSELTTRLEQRWQRVFLGEHGGLLSLTEDESVPRSQWAARLRAAARSTALDAIREINVVDVLLKMQEESASHPLWSLLDAAAPELLSCPGARRLLLVRPEGPSIEQQIREQYGETPSVVVDSSADLVFCYELEQISLTRAAASLIDNRRDYAEIASRLHTRTDVRWAPLAEVQPEQRPG